MNRLKAGLYELWARFTGALPTFFKRLRNFGLLILAIGAGLAAAPTTDALLFVLREGSKYEQPIYISTLMLAWGIVSPLVAQFALKPKEKAEMQKEKREIIMSQ